jgi:hypothetical protein
MFWTVMHSALGESTHTCERFQSYRTVVDITSFRDTCAIVAIGGSQDGANPKSHKYSNHCTHTLYPIPHTLYPEHYPRTRKTLTLNPKPKP